MTIPPKQGLYDPQFEHENCGIGLIVDMKGRQSHDIVQGALEICVNLDHRGGCGCDPITGDGAGIFIQIPDKFFRKVLSKNSLISLPPSGDYGVAFLFLSAADSQREAEKKVVEDVLKEEGIDLICWRKVPVKSEILGKASAACEPVMEQLFVNRPTGVDKGLAFERKLYLANLGDSDMESALALTHSRFSTNTFPSWPRAQPFRYICHNGEINTVRGNENWLYARQMQLASEVFGDDVHKLFPIIRADGSDSQKFDNCLEFLTLSGRSLAHSMMMMIPEPWEKHQSMESHKRDFYEFHACLMEPWDGPASIAFSDGVQIGAVLDRNGLRPSRYYVTSDDRVILASEVGVLSSIPSSKVIKKGRLEPGRMFLIDMEEGRIIEDGEVKERIAKQEPYGEWLKSSLILQKDLPEVPHEFSDDFESILSRQKAFGYTFEDLRFLIGPSADSGKQPLGSMGNDSPLAILSDKSQLLFNYFKQLFAQ
ncbi:MAG: glutamate synthase subunit alpha, partial [Opitutae bacterium]|nr:glutamate synthase subunit alpha [Opitutae bacterium]